MSAAPSPKGRAIRLRLFGGIAALAVGTSGCTIYSGRTGAVQPPPAKTRAGEQRVVYTPAGWPQALEGDLFVPEGPGPFPGVVVVHGGGWDARDRGDMRGASKALAHRGFVALNIDYRLAPAALYPAAVDDVRAAVEFLRSNAAAYRVDPERLGGWGYSAGAHLVMMAATTPAAGVPRLRAVVAGGLPADLQRYPGSPIIGKFIGKSIEEAPDVWREASPISHASQAPPTFLFQGTMDRLVYPDECLRMSEALRANGIPAEVLQLRGLGHITTFLFGSAARRQGLDFLDRYLRSAGIPREMPTALAP